MRKPRTKETCYEMLEIEILLGMFALFLLKNVLLERSVMKRFVEDQSGYRLGESPRNSLLSGRKDINAIIELSERSSSEQLPFEEV